MLARPSATRLDADKVCQLQKFQGVQSSAARSSKSDRVRFELHGKQDSGSHLWGRREPADAKSTELAGFDVLKDLLRRLDSGKRRAFHKALPLVKRIRMLAGKVEVADRRSFIAGD